MYVLNKMLRQIKDPKHLLHYLLPPVKVSRSQMVLRPYQIPLAKTLWKGLCIILHYQEVLVLLHNLHV